MRAVHGRVHAHEAELARREGARPRVRVLEGASRPGGLIRSQQVEGLLLEGGPDSMVTHKPQGLALCRRLGLDNQLLSPIAESSGLELVHRGRLAPLPPPPAHP